MKSLRKRFVNIIFASKGSVGRAARLSGHCHCRSSWRAVCRPLWSLQVCFVSIHFVYMFNLWSLSQLFQLDHLAPLQAVHGRVQPWHTNLPCETWPGGSGLSFVLHFLELKALSNVEKFKSKKAFESCSQLETITQTINMLQIFDIQNTIFLQISSRSAFFNK